MSPAIRVRIPNAELNISDLVQDDEKLTKNIQQCGTVFIWRKIRKAVM